MSNKNFSFGQVLLVDDSEIDVLVNRRLMELTSFTKSVIVAGSAEEALHYLKEECRSADEAPDWIFLDMHLPTKSGYDFIDEFDTLPEEVRNKSKIIILSVFQKPEHLKKAMEYPYVFGQLDKPLTQQALRELVSKNYETINVSS
ncbi:MAG TPA: response regulator [Bacteroidia bacterium]|nr:response regulator [Bacteroidia bacterium]